MNGSQPEFPHLKNAPISEALIDLRVRLDPGFEVMGLKDLHREFEAEFPIVEEQKLLQQTFGPLGAPDAKVEVQHFGIRGFLFKSQDGKNIIQFRKDGFTFNRLHPYTSWGEMFPQAWHFWKLFSAAVHPVEISRIAVRYINKLQLPGPGIELRAYLKTAPVVPPGAPGQVNGFASRLIIVDAEKGHAANVIQIMESTADPAALTTILDIDAYKDDLSNTSEEALLRDFSALRTFKNQIFFGSLGEKALELYR